MRAKTHVFIENVFPRLKPYTAHSSRRDNNTSFTQNAGFFFFILFCSRFVSLQFTDVRRFGFFFREYFYYFFYHFFVPSRTTNAAVAVTVFIVFGTKNPPVSVSPVSIARTLGVFSLFYFFPFVAPGRVIYTGRARVRLAGLNFRQFIRLRRGARITKTENRYVNVLRDGCRSRAEPYGRRVWAVAARQ